MRVRSYGINFRLFIVAALALAAVLAAVAFLLLRPRTVWLVDEACREQWERILGTVEPPRRLRVVADSAMEGRELPRNWRGFVISVRGPLERAEPEARAVEVEAEEAAAETEAAAEPETEAAAETGGEAEAAAALADRTLVLYPGLAATREHQGALLLALDPWMMFRDFKDPAVSRERVDSDRGGEGVLIMPGRDMDSRWAWAAQLLQRQSGVFPEDPALWQAAVDGLFRGNSRFQPGAETYGWLDAMPLLYRSSPAWIYAPLSRIRLQPSLETSGLEANRYPDAADWHEFGIQATMLWAMPFGREGSAKKLAPLRSWLEDRETQTAIANTLGWIPAHPTGAPYNAISRSARLAYLSSSFIWTFQVNRSE